MLTRSLDTATVSRIVSGCGELDCPAQERSGPCVIAELGGRLSRVLESPPIACRHYDDGTVLERERARYSGPFLGRSPAPLFAMMFGVRPL